MNKQLKSFILLMIPQLSKKYISVVIISVMLLQKNLPMSSDRIIISLRFSFSFSFFSFFSFSSFHFFHFSFLDLVSLEKGFNFFFASIWSNHIGEEGMSELYDAISRYNTSVEVFESAFLSLSFFSNIIQRYH